MRLHRRQAKRGAKGMESSARPQPIRKTRRNRTSAASTKNVIWGNPNSVPRTLPPEVDQLCDGFLGETVAFANSFTELVGLSDAATSRIQGMIVARCSEAIAQARLLVLESSKS